MQKNRARFLWQNCIHRFLGMFKKDPQPKASANIKSSERRKLLQTICNTYRLPQEKLTRDSLLELLPANTKQATFKSVQGYSGTIYFDDNETPTWFKSRDSQVFPSLYTLWKCPYVLPVIKTHPHVITILSGGADLMLPGTIPPFDARALKGTVVGVVDSANPTVIKAIGRCNINMTQFDRVIGRTGTAVEILHHLGDELFRLNKLVDIPMPEQLDIELPLVQDESQNDDEQPEDEPQVDQQQQEKPQAVAATPESGVSIEDVAEAVSTLTLEEIDHLFTRALIQTIKLDTFDLPVKASTFMGHVYKNLPIIDSSYCNVKKTSWKKTAKFLKAMEKEKYLSIKGKDDDILILELMNKLTPVIETFVPHKTVASKSNSSQPTPSKKENEMNIVHLYKPTNKSRIFFNKVGENFANLYTAIELRGLLEKYIKIQDLVNIRNPKNIRIDDDLKAVTNLGPESTPRDKVFKAFLTNFSPHYQIIKPGETTAEIHRGEPPKILIITEMKIGRKIITRVSNFEHFHIKPHLLSDELKVKCSGSSTIGPYPQNPKVTEVTVQGPHGKLIIELFKAKGVPVSFIEFEDKVKKKKKRS